MYTVDPNNLEHTLDAQTRLHVNIYPFRTELKRANRWTHFKVNYTNCEHDNGPEHFSDAISAEFFKEHFRC